MKICVAQTRPIKGCIKKNIKTHKEFIHVAVAEGTDIIVFPELSLTGYEPQLAKYLATTQDDRRFDDFQAMSDRHNITIGVGVPTQRNTDLLISMLIFQPHTFRQTYSKQILHFDELPYFIEGHKQTILAIEQKKVAPAICYESLQIEHAEDISKNSIDIYMASVAKPVKGIAKAFKHYPNIAKKYSMVVLMSNSVGPCDDFESGGQSAIWNKDGLRVGELNNTDEGLLIYDTNSRHCLEILMS